MYKRRGVGQQPPAGLLPSCPPTRSTQLLLGLSLPLSLSLSLSLSLLVPLLCGFRTVLRTNMSLMLKIASLNWQEESFPGYQDFFALAVLVVFFPAVRVLLDRFIFERVARRLVLGKGHKKHSVEASRGMRKLDKFKESAWKFIYFLSSEMLVLSVTYDEPWFTNTQNFWVGPGDKVWPDQKMKLKLKGLYMYAAGFYTYSIFALLFWETRRSDFWVSMSHHLATVAVIILSYIFRFARVGSMVLALHDATDIFMEAAKMCKYSGFDAAAVILFILFDLVWVLLRLTYFPFWIIRSTSYEVILTLDMEKHKVDGPIYYHVFNTLLFTLLVIHIYWSVLIFRIIRKQLQSGELEGDIRSDSEGEGEHED